MVTISGYVELPGVKCRMIFRAHGITSGFVSLHCRIMKQIETIMYYLYYTSKFQSNFMFALSFGKAGRTVMTK